MARSNKLSVQWGTAQFNRFIADFLNATGADTSTALKKFTFDLMNRVILRTPVATGRARAGWTAAGKELGIKVPRPKLKPGDKGGPIDEGEYEEHLEGDRQWIRVANNVDYIMDLEYGHSKQAPFGMVRISMAELRSQDTLLTDIMEMYQARWGGIASGKRAKIQGNVLGDAFGQIKNMELPARRPKPT